MFLNTSIYNAGLELINSYLLIGSDYLLEREREN